MTREALQTTQVAAPEDTDQEWVRIPDQDTATIHAPRVRDALRSTAISLTVACVIPALLFTSTLVVFSISVAVVVALAWTCSAISWRWVTKRPPSGLLILSVSIMAVKSAFTLATGNTYVYFIQPVFSDAVVATVFLVSLASARPVVARLAPDFYPMRRDVATIPAVRRLFARLTLMWGLVILVKGSVTFYLLMTQPLVDFVVIKNSAIITLTFLGASATIWMSAVVARKEDLFSAA